LFATLSFIAHNNKPLAGHVCVFDASQRATASAARLREITLGLVNIVAYDTTYRFNSLATLTRKTHTERSTASQKATRFSEAQSLNSKADAAETDTTVSLCWGVSENPKRPSNPSHVDWSRPGGSITSRTISIRLPNPQLSFELLPSSLIGPSRRPNCGFI
jgi:hypothetical protein